MRRYSPPYHSPPRRGYGGRGRSPPRRGYGGRREQNNGSLLVRNIPLSCRPEDLRGPFERFGPVRDVYLPKDYYTGVRNCIKHNQDNKRGSWCFAKQPILCNIAVNSRYVVEIVVMCKVSGGRKKCEDDGEGECVLCVPECFLVEDCLLHAYMESQDREIVINLTGCDAPLAELKAIFPVPLDG